MEDFRLDIQRFTDGDFPEFSEEELERLHELNKYAFRGLEAHVKYIEAIEKFQAEFERIISERENSNQQIAKSSSSVLQASDTDTAEEENPFAIFDLYKQGKDIYNEIIDYRQTDPSKTIERRAKLIQISGDITKMYDGYSEMVKKGNVPGLSAIGSMIAFVGAYVATADGTTQDEANNLFNRSIDVVGDVLKLTIKPSAPLVDLGTALAKAAYMGYTGQGEFWNVFADEFFTGPYAYLKDIFKWIMGLDPSILDDATKSALDLTNLHNELNGNYIIGADGVTIRNYTPGRLIVSGAGNDSIYNSDGYQVIDGVQTYSPMKNVIFSGAGNDAISNYGDGVLIYAGEGNDRIGIQHSGREYILENNFVYGGDGDDYINVDRVNGSYLSGGNGNDNIFVHGSSYTQIYGDDGDDRIENYHLDPGIGSTISGGKGNDYLVNSNASSKLFGDAGDDTIYNHGAEVTIDGGEDNDHIENSGSDVVISGGAGNNHIGNGREYDYHGGNNVTINTADGNNTIFNDGNNVIINAGNGTNSISNKGSEVAINAGDGDDTIYNRGSDVTIDGGDGDNRIGSSGSKFIECGSGNDSISSNCDDATINAGKGNDTIYSDGDNTTINAGAGDDFISNGGRSNNVTIDAASGNDIILNHHFASKVFGGLGNDSIRNTGYNSTISGGEGKDSVYNVASSAVIETGIGDDFIYNEAEENVKLSGGDGADTISNYGASVSIGGGAGNDSIYNVANNVTISGGEGSDTLKLDAVVSKVTFEDFSKGDIIELATTAKLEKVDGGIKAGRVIIIGLDLASVGNEWDNFSYQSVTVAGAKIDDTKIIYDETNGTTKFFALNGLKDTSGVSLNGAQIILTAAALNNRSADTITLTDEDGGEDYELVLADDVDTTAEPLDEVKTFKDGTLNYTAASVGEYYSLNGSQVIYTPATTPTTFTISGLSNGAKFGENVTVDDKTVKISDGAMTSTHEKISLTSADGYSLTLNDSLVADIAFAQNGNKVTLSGTTAGYKLVNGAYEWQEKVGGEVLTITGLKSGATLTEKMFTTSGGKITFKPTQALLPNNPTTLKISNGVINTSSLTKTKAIAAHWNGNIYVSAKTASSWTTGKNSVKYTAATGGVNQFTISGLKSGAKVSDFTPDSSGKINLTAELLPDSTASKLELIKIISGGKYAFALPSGTSLATKGETIAATFKGSGTYTYTSAYDKAYYSGNATAITYNAATAPTTFKLSGLKKGLKVSDLGKAVKISGKTITVNDSAVDLAILAKAGSGKIALTGGGKNYTTLKLASTLTKKISHAAAFTNSGTTFTYKGAYDDAYFSGSGTSYTYNKSTEAAATTFTVTNLKSNSDKSALLKAFDSNKKTLTLTAANLNAQNVTISTGYKLALNSDVDTTKENISKWSVKSGTATYLTGGTGFYYALNSKKNAITYTASVAPATKKIELSGVKGTPTLSGSTVKLTANNFKSNVKVASNAGGYTLALSGDFKNKILTGTTGADKINSSGSNLVISGGKGNDKATLGSNNTFFYAKGDGNDILYNFGNDDKIKLTGTTKAQTSISGKDVIVTTDGGKITVKNAATNKKITIVDSKDKVLSARTYSADRIVDGKSITLTSAFKGTFNAKNFTKVDGSAVVNGIKISGGASASTLTGGTKNDSIAGGKANDKIFGGKGNDTLTGGKGNDSLWGDAGKDTFLYADGDGKDIIYGFANDDMLKITGKFSTSYDKKKKEIAVTVGKTTSAITLKDFTATTFNINSTNYKISGSKLIKK